MEHEPGTLTTKIESISGRFRATPLGRVEKVHQNFI